MNIIDTLVALWESTGIYLEGAQWQNYVMILISFVLFYLAVVKQFEPLLLLPIAFGMFIINIPGAEAILYGADHHLTDIQAQEVLSGLDYDGDGLVGLVSVLENPAPRALNYGLFHYIGMGVQYVIFPPVIFLGIGAMTDFGPLIANPKSLIIGAGAQLGVFVAFTGATLFGFPGEAAAAIGIIGGADGPTAIYVTQKLYPELLPTIAIAAYSYMALIPIIQPFFMRLLTTKKQRQIRMEQLRPVSKREKLIFPILVTLVVGIFLPDAIPLLGMLMLGNFMKESLVVDRLVKTASNELMNIVTIFLGVIVGTKAVGSIFLSLDTIGVILMGLAAFCFGTIGGILTVHVQNLFSKKKINPLIGSAGVSAVPMAARVSQKVGQEECPDNYLLMHAMGPNVAGVIGSAVAAGVFLAIFG